MRVRTGTTGRLASFRPTVDEWTTGGSWATRLTDHRATSPPS
ncbi:hypothetical protein PYK79_47740 [Streptomyces sp. ID05-04B]|nr:MULTISPECIES: hypothetical protein [unclassified Streptomyces]MDX5569419.1 hypothetical protein [Streptomyces sp. ID05-04B]